MADSSAKFGLQSHARSISLPCRPKPDSFNLKNPEFSLSNNSLNSETIHTNVLILAELHNNVKGLIESSPNARKVVLNHQNAAIVEESLEASIELLDSCGAIRDLYSAMNQNIRILQSALRRKGENPNVVISTYLSFKKKAKKDVTKGIKALKQLENKGQYFLHEKNREEDYHNVLVQTIMMFKKVSVFTISVLRSFLSYVDNKANSRHFWTPLISKITASSSTATSRGETEMEIVDFGLKSHIKSTKSKLDMEVTGKMLEQMHGRIQDIESEIYSLQKLLIQHRVFLLNILTP